MQISMKSCLLSAVCSLGVIGAGAVNAAYDNPVIPNLDDAVLNALLVPGEYEFDNTTIGANQSINDSWVFTVNEQVHAIIDVTSTEFLLGNFLLLGNDEELDVTFTGTAGNIGEGIYDLGILDTGITYTINVVGSTANSLGLAGGGYDGDLNLSAVPIPAAAWLFGSALLGVVGVGRSRKASSAKA